ncbi:hypothetical protein ES707_13455 [subsurface metagenome]
MALQYYHSSLQILASAAYERLRQIDLFPHNLPLPILESLSNTIGRSALSPRVQPTFDKTVLC